MKIFIFLYQLAHFALVVLFFLYKIILWVQNKLYRFLRWCFSLLFYSQKNEELIEFIEQDEFINPTSLPKPSISKYGKKRVVIVGGGYAGTSIAKDLEWDFDVTLIDSKDYFEFTPSKLKTLIDPSHIYKIQMRHDQYLIYTQIVMDWVYKVNIDHVVTANKNIPFDYLVICTGARCHEAKFPSIGGVETRGNLVESTIVSSRSPNLEYYYHALKNANRILIIGGGTVGVEMAAEIIDSFPDKELTIVHSGRSLVHRSPAKASEYAERWFKQRNVRLILQDRIIKQDGNRFQTSQGQILEAELAFICTGNIPNSECLKNGLFGANCLTSDGFVLVNPYLQIPHYPHIFVGGDLTFIPKEEEKLCQTAGAAADIIIRNIRNLERNKPLKPYEPSQYPILISLGRYDCILTYRGFTLTGFLPALMKEFVEFKEMVHYWDWKRFQFWQKKQTSNLKYSSYVV